MSTADQERDGNTGHLAGQVRERLGVLPNFFRAAPGTEPLMAGLWAFTQAAYLDCPLPPLFKERLFVHLSRFCEVRYCIIRHACFLAGLGRPAGDPDAPAQTVEQITGLLRRPAVPATLEAALRRLEAIPGPAAMPGPGTQSESDLFDALAVIFLDAAPAPRSPRRPGTREPVCYLACWPSSAPRTTGPRPIRICRWNRAPSRSWTSTRSSPGC